MSVSTVLVLAVTLYALPGSAQELSNPLILNDVCLPEDDLASRAADQDISDALRNIASRLVNGSNLCLDMIYVMAFTSSVQYADSSHPQDIEVIAAGQTVEVTLPDRPGHYDFHKGDIWKLSIFDDLGFLPGSCIRVCNIQNVTILPGGTNGWNIDSLVTFGCTTGLGCKPITQDIDVFRWVDGNGPQESRRFPLTKISGASCSF